MASASSTSSSSTTPTFAPLLCVVDFHHARGPEVEHWFGVPEDEDPAVENEWPLLPFMALSDGAHAYAPRSRSQLGLFVLGANFASPIPCSSTEDFSYFTLRHEKGGRDGKPTSLFGISCTRQLDANELINRPSDVTRSTVQKAVVVIAGSPGAFGHVRERLSVVVKAWFDQR